MDPERTTGRLVLAGTPIGNAQDASRRLVDLLATADVVAAEDTRRLHRLAAALEVAPRGRVLSYHEHNESARTPELVEAVRGGATVALVTDAGMPSVSDPGYRLVRGCVEAGLPVSVVPGPSAVLTALAVSGLPSDRFAFEGFAPRKPGERARVFAALAHDERTLLFFESPHRTAATLSAMADAFGADRPAAVCRELTKTYEEVVRGSLAELAAWAHEGEVRGEVCLVVQGSSGRTARSRAELVAEVGELVAAGRRMKDAVREVAARDGVPSRELYDAVTVQRKGSPDGLPAGHAE
ncbi:16S rRNA (cytidine(1402)-2'-O)-methyltransferase [Kineococcus rhizosphaerae]|uniref:16S rRNA (cytidine(1402)-2'-O)-methyltransferase n=1 Tax=Kineococcus rhizosphaerae TaxID=559628 RepID=UPI001FEA5DA9|nr:16S rRNA (cytidine(1402)-2'-O)-methyltransferase [Kineococcus rhizosphaerae]